MTVAIVTKKSIIGNVKFRVGDVTTEPCFSKPKNSTRARHTSEPNFVQFGKKASDITEENTKTTIV